MLPIAQCIYLAADKSKQTIAGIDGMKTLQWSH